MSTEQLNNDNTQPLDKEWEEGMLSFVESMNVGMEEETPSKQRRQCKWVLAIKRHLSRRALTLIATTTATIMLAVVVALILRTGKASPKSTEDGAATTPTVPLDEEIPDETPQIPLLDKTKSESSSSTATAKLTKVDVQNLDDSYTILYDESKKTYVIQGYDDIELSPEILLTLRYYTETIAAADQVKTVSDLSAYGLDKPQAVANITYSDGTSAQLRIGNITPTETGYYGQLEGREEVYIFNPDSVSLFRHRATSFVDATLITPPSVKSDDKNGSALLKEITFTGSAHPTALTMRRSSPSDSEELTYFSYIITSPYIRCTTDKVSSALSGFKSLTASQALYLHPTEEQKAKLGFNDPLIHMDVTMAVETDDSTNTTSEVNAKIYYNTIRYQLTVGSVDENGNYIVMLDGINAIFLVDKAGYEYLIGCTYHNSVNSYLFFKNITNLECISVELNGEKHDFYLTHYPEKEDQDDNLVVKKDGKVYSTEDFRKLYELIMALERHGVPDAEPTGDVSFTLSLYDTDGNLYLSAQYYESTATMCTVKTSEGELLTTLWSDVSFFLRQIQNYLNGDKVLLRN